MFWRELLHIFPFLPYLLIFYAGVKGREPKEIGHVGALSASAASCIQLYNRYYYPYIRYPEAIAMEKPIEIVQEFLTFFGLIMVLIIMSFGFTRYTNELQEEYVKGGKRNQRLRVHAFMIASIIFTIGILLASYISFFPQYKTAFQIWFIITLMQVIIAILWLRKVP